MTSSLVRFPSSTFQLTMTIPWARVKTVFDKILEEWAKKTAVSGFRRGTAPKKLVKEKVDQQKLKEEVIKETIPQAYTQALQEHQLNPVVTPQIEIVSFEENQDWVFRATACEKPQINLNNYQEIIQKVTAKSKIILPGKEPQAPKLEEILEALVKAVGIEISPLLLESEVNRLLSQILEEIKSLGLTLEQYLSSVGKTTQSLREEYTQKAEKDLKLEFILEEIAAREKITVSENDLNQAIEKAPDPKTKEIFSQRRYLLASVLRRQKTLDFLQNL